VSGPQGLGRYEELTCKELVELVTEYFEGALSVEDRARFDAHLEECPYCVTYIAQMGQTIDALGELTEESIPAEARDRLLAAFRDWKR
jgi:anti-sigma factor RsiW